MGLAALGAGCAAGPDHSRPAMALPGAYSAAATTRAAGDGDLAIPAEWWGIFGEAQLSALMSQLEEGNRDTRAALARLEEARALRGVARAGLLPDLSARAGAGRGRVSEHSNGGRQAGAFGQPLENSAFDAGLDASWELDFFGGRRRALEGAGARVEAAAEGHRDVLLAAQAELALAHLDARGAARQLVVARRNLATQEETLALAADRLLAGLGSELDQTRALGQVAATRAAIPALEEMRQRALNRMAVLLGKPPGAWGESATTDPTLPATPPRVPVGLPSDLLKRRPDIRRAERELAAATAAIGEAQADLFPKFYLTGAAGLQSVDAGDFLTGGSRFWSFGPGVRWPVFSAGKIRQNVRAKSARQEESLARYEQTALLALEDVENSLTAFGLEQETHRALAEAEAAQREASRHARLLHEAGVAGFLDVLDAERELLRAEDALAQSERRLAQRLVRLYKSLGGGWEVGKTAPDA